MLTPAEYIRANYKQAAQSSEVGIQRVRGLQFAARQDWYDDATGYYVDTFIIHYATATGAESDYLSMVKYDTKSYGAQGSYTVPGMAQSKVFVRAKLDSFGNSASLGLALVGNDVLRLYMLNPASPDHTTMASLLRSRCHTEGDR
ncbi:hypothetical protein [Streptacidiphilus monticola]|uniref:Uncharacterized protein n=1 Tax=Streptacidiphilus monticola TaxID=2161674 RepID=A0ABW1GCR4_9ACTN